MLWAAWKLNAKADKARIERFSSWVDTQHRDTTGSLREGLDGLSMVRPIELSLV